MNFSLSRQSKPFRSLSVCKGQISIEYLVVVGLVALALGGISWYVWSARQERIATTEAQSLVTLINDIDNHYKPAGSLASFSMASVGDSGFTPTGWNSNPANHRLTTPTGALVYIRAYDFYNANDSMWVDYRMKMTQRQCSQFLRSIEPSFNAIISGFQVIKYTPNNIRMDSATVGRVCKVNHSGTFAFYAFL